MVDLCTIVGCTAIQTAVVAVVAAPGIASCMPQPLSRERLHLTCRGRYRAIEDRERPQVELGAGLVVQGSEIVRPLHQYRQSLDEGRAEAVQMAVVEQQGH